MAKYIGIKLLENPIMTVLSLVTAITLAQNLSSSSSTPQQLGGIYFIFIFVVVMVAVRMYRGINGRVYSRTRVLRIPIVYTILTVVTVLSLSLLDMDIVISLALIPVGIIIGLRLGTGVKFVKRNNTLYYVRSPIIMILWLASFIARFLLEYLYPGNLTVMFAVDSALTVTTGIFIGEAINVIRKKNEYGDHAENEDQSSDSFRINV